MAKKDSEIMIPNEVIMNKIYTIRGKKVMLDRDLAELYGVETKVLKQTVKRNIRRFPPVQIRKDYVILLEKIEDKLADDDNQFLVILEFLKQLEKYHPLR